MPRRKGARHHSQAAGSLNAQEYQLSNQPDGIVPPGGDVSPHFNGGFEKAHLPASDTPPMTPQRPRSMYDSPSLYGGSFNGQRSGNVSATESASSKHRRSSKAHNKRQSGSHMNARMNGNSQTKKGNNCESFRIPSITPSEAYAGPTFHASPAPSSLPMPKFFSKSVPDINKAKGLATMMANEAAESDLSPESSEGSPSQEKAERSNQQPREESPLDIFFKADREEKARARQGSSESPYLREILNSQAARTLRPATGSPSPVRHHSRHDTGSSTNGLFPLELEDGNSEGQADSTNQSARPGDISRASSAPVDVMTQTGSDEALKRYASSLALKKLLMSPKPEHPDSPVLVSSENPVKAGKTANASPTPEASGPFTPTKISGSDVRILSRNQPATLPQLQKQFGTSLAQNGSPRPRPPSSNLRQQLSAPQSPVQDGVPELPSTPTPSRINGATERPTSRNVHNPPFSPLRSTAFWGVNSPSGNSTTDVSSMENELRRVLKLDTLGSDGANGVRS